MSFTAYQWAWTQPLEKDEHLIILIAMADIASEEGLLFASAPYIGDLARKTERTVRRALEGMAATGVLSITERPGTSSIIQLNIPDSFVVKVRREREQRPKHGRPRKNPGHGDGKPRTPAQQTPVTVSDEPIREPLEGTSESLTALVGMADDVVEVDIVAEAFERFWLVYPKRQDRKGALGAFRIAVRKLKPMGLISGRVDFLISRAQALADNLGVEKHFAPSPERWLRKEKWDDELTPRRGTVAATGGAGPDLARERNDQRLGSLLTGTRAAVDQFERERGSF